MMYHRMTSTFLKQVQTRNNKEGAKKHGNIIQSTISQSTYREQNIERVDLECKLTAEALNNC